MNDLLSPKQLYNYAGDSITVLRKSNLCPFCSRQAERTRLRRPLVSILPIRNICKAPCILGLKNYLWFRLHAVKKIGSVGQKKFFLKQFLMLLADLGVHGLTTLVTKNKVSVRSYRVNVYHYVINSYIHKIRRISTINSVFKLKLFVLVVWPSGPQGDGFHAIAWGSTPDIAYFILFKSKFSFYVFSI